MGCGASKRSGVDDDGFTEPKPAYVHLRTLATIPARSEGLRLVVNADGDRALVHVCEDASDLSIFYAALQRAERSAAAAARGALRSAMRRPAHNLDSIGSQVRVLKLSLRPSIGEFNSARHGQIVKLRFRVRST